MLDLFFYLLPFILGGALSGIICGLLPFFLSLKRRRPLLGLAALTVCTTCGVIFGAILAFPVAVSFSAAILLTKRRFLRRRRDKLSISADTFTDDREWVEAEFADDREESKTPV